MRVMSMTPRELVEEFENAAKGAALARTGDAPGYQAWFDAALLAMVTKAMEEGRKESDLQVEELKATNTRLNRRCQEAESAARETAEKVKAKGMSLGRGLAGWSAGDLRRQLDEIRKEWEKNCQHSCIHGETGPCDMVDLLEKHSTQETRKPPPTPMPGPGMPRRHGP
jgi:hypothetical protein